MKIFYENSSILANKVQSALEGKDTRYALSILADEQNYAALKTGSAELVPVISKYICGEYESENINLFNGCVSLLQKVVDNALPDELLVQLLEIIESSIDTTQFTTILSFLFKVLQRITRDRSNFLSWTVNSLQVRLNKCSLPEYKDASVKSDNDVFYIEILYQDILRFYDEIIPYFSQWFKEQDIYRLILIKYLIQLLAKPIGYLDLGPHSEKSKLRKTADNIVRKILSLCKDPFEYFGMDADDFVNPTIFAYGMFLHFVLDENSDYEMVPRVYTNDFVFQSSLVYIAKLLRSVSNYVILKGLSTLETNLKRSPRLSYHVLDIEANKTLCEMMEKIIVYNNYEEIRMRALEVFKLYLFKLEVRGQYLLFTNLMYKVGNAGLSGYLITQYKEILHNSQKKGNPDVKYLKGEKTYIFIKDCYETIKTEGSFQYEKIIALLNLMRYVVIKEKKDNCDLLKINTEIWKKEFFNRLQCSMDKLKEEFKEIYFNVHNDKPHPAMNFDDDPEIESLSKEDKIKALKMSLTQVEMTNSLLKRLDESIAEIKK